jgi:hypothetical protein
VLLTSHGGDLSVLGLPSLPQGCSIRVAVEDLNLSQLKCLVVIENQDCFDHWHLARIPKPLQETIAVYRGHDKSLATGAKQFLHKLNEDCKVVVFPDLDPAGLQIAMTTPGSQSLLIPKLTDELVNCGSEQDFLEQAKARQFLANRDLGGWAPVWQDLKARRRSIKQQHMLALQIPLTLIAFDFHLPDNCG